MELYWKFIIVVCLLSTFVVAWILARFIERLELRVEQLEKNNDMNTRVISKEIEGKLLSVSTSLTQDLRNGKDKSALLSKMKEAEHLFGLAIKELEN